MSQEGDAGRYRGRGAQRTVVIPPMEHTPTRVLLIEDSQTYAALVRQMLKSQSGSFEVVWAGTLAEGIRCLTAERPDVVLLDLTLPDSQGLRTLAAVRAAAGPTPVVVLTVVDDEEVAVSALKEGAADYLVKGEVTARWLGKSLELAIDRARAEAERGGIQREVEEFSRHAVHEIDGDVAVVRFLDSRIVHPEAISEIEGGLRALIERAGIRRLVIDFEQVDYFSNAAMGMLVKIEKKLRTLNGSLRLCNMNEDVYEHFVTRHLHQVFRIFPSREAALSC